MTLRGATRVAGSRDVVPVTQDHDAARLALVRAGRGAKAHAPEVVLWLVLAAVFGYAAYHVSYTTYNTYDDTGGWTIGVWSFLHHGGLYKTIYAQAGPFYYEFWAAVYGVTGLAVNPDTGIFMSLLAWVAATMLIGIALRVFTGRLALGVLGSLTAFILLEVNASEAMEPAHLAYVLLGVVLVCLCLWPRLGDRGRLWASLLVGALCIATLFTKVNIGALACAAVCFAVAVCWPGRRGRLLLRPLACVGLLVVPAVLMSSALHGPLLTFFKGTFLLSEVSLLGLGAVALVLPVKADVLRMREVKAGVVGAVVAAVVISAIAIADGTPPARIITGALLGQRNLVKLFSVDPPWPTWAFTVALVSTGIALLAAHLLRLPLGRWGHVALASVPAAAARLAVGLWMLVMCIPYFHLQVASPPVWFASYAMAVSFTWVAVIGRGTQEAPTHAFVRLALAALGCLGCLEVFPVAGSQEGWASLLLVPVAVICIWDGVEMLGARARSLRWHWLLGWASVCAAGAFLVVVQAWPVMRAGQLHYDAWVSPGVPGGSAMRLRAGTALAISRTTTTLDRHCSTFVSSPGLNSFYFFTGQTPPTGLNTTQWRTLLSTSQQNTILRRVRTIPRLCVLYSQAINDFWHPGFRPALPSRLYDYMQRDFTPVARHWIYTVKVRK